MAPPKEKDSGESDKEKRTEEIRRILSETDPEFMELEKISQLRSVGMETASKEYKEFREEEKVEKMSIYEKLCSLSERLNMEPDKGMGEKMQKAIDFAHLNVTPKGAFSFAVITAVFIVIVAVVAGLAGVSLTTVIILFALSIASLFALTKYPEFLADNFRIRAAEEIILAIIYMVIYMRTSPQMEGAVRFAAKNLTGPLAYDLRKIMWDVETRKYETIYDAMTEYLKRWEKNKEFIEAIQLIRTSLEQPESKRHQMLDEAINIILEGTEEKMRHYSQALRTPVVVIYALGITLPVVVLVMFPIIILMLSKEIKPIFLIIGYDVVLPIMIFAISYEILRRRPIGYSSPDTSLHPKYSPLGRLKVNFFGKEKIMPLWPVGVFVSVPFLVLGVGLMLYDPSQTGFINLAGSLVIIWGIAMGFASVFLLESKKKIGLRNQIRKIQDEFSEALFQLGNRLALGNPMEKAMEQTVEKASDLSISELFRKTIKNIKRGNLSLEAALFDKKFGAVWEYPSKLVINIMRIILEATKKGVKNAALSAISISRYVKQIHSIEEKLTDMLSESTASMRILGMFIAPLIAGVTVTMTAVMMMIFGTLKELFKGIEITETTGGLGLSNLMLGGWGEIGEILSIGIFQITVGIYVLEICYLLAYLVSGIDYGQGDLIARRDLAGWNILIGMLVYIFSVMITYFIFAPMVGMLIMGF